MSYLPTRYPIGFNRNASIDYFEIKNTSEKMIDAEEIVDVA